MMGRIDDRVLQQLVDGELDEQSYRETLLALADEPDGWRRCALAFLEDQCLRRQLVCEPRKELVIANLRPEVRAPRAIPLLIAIAASFLLAFVGGYELNRWLSQRGADGIVAEIPSQVQDDPVVAQSHREQSSGRMTGRSPLGRLQLVMDGPDGARGESIEVPYYALDDSSSRWLMDDRSSFSPQMLDVLEQAGQEVRHSKFWAPVDLDDGRQLVIPVEQLEITPVSQAY